jgi:hypothetical protein
MSFAVIVIGMIIAGLIIVFSEVIAEMSLWCHRRLFKSQFEEGDLKRAKVLFIICGTAMMIMNAVALRALLTQ